MRIAQVDVRAVTHKNAGDFRPSWSPGLAEPETVALVARVETESGIEGWGAGECRGRAAELFIREQVVPLLKGRDLEDVEWLGVELDRVSIEYRWPWCVELAVWDALGKTAGRSVAEMLGTTRRELRPYVSFGESRDLAERQQDVARAREHGLSAFKLRFRAESLEADLDVVRGLREAYGDAIDLMVDANQAVVTPGSGKYLVWDFKAARYVADALADLGVLWLEEPLPEDREDDLAELRRVSRIPIAGGELRTGVREFRPLITHRLYDIVQPDVTYGGGILGCRKIATIAEGAGLQVIPHTWSNGLGWLANFHLACSIRSCEFLETPMDPPTLTLEDFMFPLANGWHIDPVKGKAVLPEGPGFGAEVREDVAAAVRGSG